MLSILFCACSLSVFGQGFERVVFNEKIANGYYLALMPKTDAIKGVLVLMPGFGEAAENIFPESKLPNVAYANGLLTIMIAGGQKLYADEGVTARLNDCLVHVKKKYNVAPNKFIIGGFSAGGAISVRYAEYCLEKKTEAPIIPQAVFTVDSPIDLFAIWDYFEREKLKNFSEVGVAEANFVSEMMLNEIGDPSKNADRYNALTPFNKQLNEPGNEKYLASIPVRVYHDIDVEWQLKNRRRSLFDSNALEASELISRLLLAGNNHAEFMTAKRPGFRSNGMRHTHSWSIVDEVEMIQWVLKSLDQ